MIEIKCRQTDRQTAVPWACVWRTDVRITINSARTRILTQLTEKNTIHLHKLYKHQSEHEEKITSRYTFVSIYTIITNVNVSQQQISHTNTQSKAVMLNHVTLTWCSSLKWISSAELCHTVTDWERARATGGCACGARDNLPALRTRQSTVSLINVHHQSVNSLTFTLIKCSSTSHNSMFSFTLWIYAF